MKPNTIDSLVAYKIAEHAGPDVPCYSSDIEAAITAAGVFTRNGGSVRLLKSTHSVWEVTAWAVPRGRQHTESGPFAAALCRAMLAAVGVSVKSSDG